MPDTALITGASGGIGEELARLLAANGANVVLLARSAAKLTALAEELGRAHAIQASVIAQDLSVSDAVDRVVGELAARGITIDILINNAGFATYGPFVQTPIAEEARLLQVNVIALTMLTKRLLPTMIQRRHGRVLNVASTAAFQPGPLMAVYYASKAYVLSFSEAIAEELDGTGVTVTTLAPGPTTTGFQSAAGLHPSAPSGGTAPMTSMSVAEEGLAAMYAGKRLVVPGFQNRIVVLANRLLPRRMIVRQVRRIQEKRREVSRAARETTAGVG